MFNDVKRQSFQELISEISKPRPNSEKIRVLTRRLEIEFSDDPIEQMTLVLKRINDASPGTHLQEIGIGFVEEHKRIIDQENS